MRNLQDTDPMPFGKHKGRLMQDVPADYLHWLWHEGLKNKTRTSDVANYIERNLSALKEEHPDGTWDTGQHTGTEGQDRKSYSDTQDRESYTPDPDMGQPDKLPF